VTSRTQGDAWVVEGGLQPGERVIIAGLQKIQPGMTVKAVNAPIPAPAASAAVDAASAASSTQKAQ